MNKIITLFIFLLFVSRRKTIITFINCKFSVNRLNSVFIEITELLRIQI
jgi:hypothetical protein